MTTSDKFINKFEYFIETHKYDQLNFGGYIIETDRLEK